MLSDTLRAELRALERTRDQLARALAELADKLAGRDELIRWLALPYAGDPVFNTEADVFEPGHNPAHKRRLEATWSEVVGYRQGWAGIPGRPGYWAQCQTCGMWQLVNLEVTEDDQPGTQPEPEPTAAGNLPAETA